MARISASDGASRPMWVEPTVTTKLSLSRRAATPRRDVTGDGAPRRDEAFVIDRIEVDLFAEMERRGALVGSLQVARRAAALMAAPLSHTRAWPPWSKSRWISRARGRRPVAQTEPTPLCARARRLARGGRCRTEPLSVCALVGSRAAAGIIWHPSRCARARRLARRAGGKDGELSGCAVPPRARG